MSLKLAIISAMEGKASTDFSADNVNTAAVKGILEACGLNENPTYRQIRAVLPQAFALIEEAVDEILPKKLEAVLGQYAEIKSFDRDAEVQFDIDKIGKNRAKLTIARGSRAGIYRTAKLDSKWFSPKTDTETVGVFVTLEEILLGKASLADLFNNILEGFEEKIYLAVFNALAQGQSAAGSEYNAKTVNTTKAGLGASLDSVLPIVKSYGMPTIFGSYAALSEIYNPLAAASGYPNNQDSLDIRNNGFVQIYKGVRCVELPNYLVDSSNTTWAYDDKYVFVIPSDIKPVKVALKGDMYIKENENATGSVKWEAHKMIGVGVAMANNYAVISVTDLHA